MNIMLLESMADDHFQSMMSETFQYRLAFECDITRKFWATDNNEKLDIKKKNLEQILYSIGCAHIDTKNQIHLRRNFTFNI